MKRVAVAAVVAVLLVGAGVAAYFYIQSSNSVANSDTNTSDQTPTFKPQQTAGVSFVATYTANSKDSEVTTGTIEVNAAGDSKYTGMAGGKEFTSYSVAGQYVSCVDGTCIKLASNNNQESIASGEYRYSDEDFAKFSSKAVYKGKKDCPAGTCEAWGYDDDDVTTEMFIDSKNRLSKLQGERKNGSSYTITYEYKDVTVELPKNIKTITIPTVKN
ncbi:MAG TPA: hypothetical protein PL051_03265 [Candidatus Saccharibacteria bacterium]|nr:hypothetical protein [Candidatus Saccharibacteria bacterium]